MNRAPIIGVTAGFAGPSEERAFCRTANVLYCDQNYLKRVEEAGGVPMLLPHVEEKALEPLARGLDGLLLSGGEDVHPNHYGQDLEVPTCEVSEARDSFELKLLQRFLQTGRPVFAICRGIQLLNVAAGGTLIQDIPVQIGSTHHTQRIPSMQPTHEVRILPGSRLAGIFGRSMIEVNSHHHQAVDRMADGFRAAAWSEEGLIEAIEHTGNPCVFGVQWHPERLANRYAEQQPLFEYFVQACREERHGRTG